MAEIVLARVDDRLIHGQIVNEWISAVNPTHLIIIDDDLVTDKFMSDIYRALIPIWLEAKILSVDSAVSVFQLLSGDHAAPALNSSFWPGRLKSLMSWCAGVFR